LNVAPSQIDAVEMILIRIAYSASLPTPAQILDGLKKNSNSLENELPVQKFAGGASIDEKPATPTIAVGSGLVFNKVEDLVKYLEDTKKVRMLYSLKNDISISEMNDGYLKMAMSDKMSSDFVMNLHKVLTEATGKQWKIDSSRGVLGETIADVEKSKIENDQRDVSEYPLVRAILAEFKGAKIESLVRKVQAEMEDDDEPQLLFDDEMVDL